MTDTQVRVIITKFEAGGRQFAAGTKAKPQIALDCVSVMCFTSAWTMDNVEQEDHHPTD